MLLLLVPAALMFNVTKAQNINPMAVGLEATQSAMSAQDTLPVNSSAVLTAGVANVGWGDMMTNSFMVQVSLDTTQFMWDPAGVYDSTTNDGLWSVVQQTSYTIWIRNTHGPILSTGTPGGFYYYDLELKVKVKPTAHTGPAYAVLLVSVPPAMSAAYGIWDVDNTSNSNYKSAQAWVPANTLPVTFGSFTANKKGTDALLNWTTETEQNNDRFEVERSANGKDFTLIGQVKGAMNSSSTQRYSFTDNKVLNGMNYYRLKQVDLDGKSTYSKVVNLRFNGGEDIAIYPNPVSDQFTVDGLKGGEHVIVYNSLGQKVTEIIATGNFVSVPFRHMAAGNYNVVVIKDGQRLKSEPIVKK